MVQVRLLAKPFICDTFFPVQFLFFFFESFGWFPCILTTVPLQPPREVFTINVLLVLILTYDLLIMLRKPDNRKCIVQREKVDKRIMPSYHCTPPLHLLSSWFFPSERISPQTVPFLSLPVVRGDPEGRRLLFYQPLLLKKNYRG